MKQRQVTKDAVLLAALDYAALGWNVFPCHGIANGKCTCGREDCPDPGKHPRTRHGFKDAVRDENTIREWWRRWPSANVAVCCGNGLVVLDVDGAEGRNALKNLVDERKHLPLTGIVKTGRGFHYYFTTDGKSIRTTDVVRGLEIRGDGAYVIAPPSQHHSGASYEWMANSGPKCITAVPGWLALIGGDGRTKTRLADEDHETIPQGQRKRTLVRYAGKLRRDGMYGCVILAALQAMNEYQCKPPLREEDIFDIARSAESWERGSLQQALPTAPEEPTDELPVVTPGKFHFTELGNAERLAHRHGHNIRWLRDRKCWAIWDGRRWAMDADELVVAKAQETVRHIYAEASGTKDSEKRTEVVKHGRRSEHDRGIRGMLSQARPMLLAESPQFDRDPWLLNLRNGTLDLRKGRLHQHRREDFITGLVQLDYERDAKAHRWEQFLREVFQENDELINFVQRYIGYSLTGDTTERKFVILYGTGKNGKSTLVETLRFVLGDDYAAQAHTETFLVQRFTGIPADLASLAGKRLVTGTETRQGRRLDVSTVKTITGRDRIKVRFLRQNFFEYTPQFKLYLSTNHKPEIEADDQAIWDRVRLVPFNRTFHEDEQDKRLDEKLRAEAVGILAWAVHGCTEWQKHGLAVPDTVTRATVQYRSEMDVIVGFLDDCCVVESVATVRPKELHDAYAEWCQENGEKSLGLRKFGEQLRFRGFESDRTGTRRFWIGLRLRGDGDNDA